jgi:Family of unknown function (DUF5309)
MALFTNAQTTFTYNALVNAEDVSDVIANIAPTDTPFLSALKKVKASSTKHEFITDDLTAAANNAQLEGDTFAAGTRPTPVRLWNRTQISSKIVAVSRTQQASNPYGMKNMLAYQMANVSKELKRDIETALTQNTTTNAGNATTARQSRGLEGWVLTNVDAHTGYTTGAYTSDPGTAPTDGTQRAFTEALLKTALQSAYTQGGSPELIMVSPAAKQTFSTFTGNSTRFKDADATLNAAISVYVSDFGTLKVVPSRFQRARTVFILDMDYWALAELTAPTMQDLPNSYDGVGKALVTEYTLEARQEKASAAVRDIT